MIPPNDRNYQTQMAWLQNRLEALEKMEAKLREMRALAVYAAGKTLAPTEAAQVQEWMNVLHREVVALDKETAWNGEDVFCALAAIENDFMGLIGFLWFSLRNPLVIPIFQIEVCEIT